MPRRSRAATIAPMPHDAIAPAVGPGALAVIFTSLRTEGDHGYAQTADEMVALAARQPGFLGVESARGADGLGITVSYWRDEEAIRAWRAHADHLAAQRAGRERWYRAYRVRVCRVEREYGFEAAG
ncbi:MAG TPA: antibiotic biosynthesis monooxygenase [Anaeromyxobacteraceae bacterium]|nr:antibiotic biosynthesis monooxygenase [Anaeromyxobacteraceae bacterium]